MSVFSFLEAFVFIEDVSQCYYMITCISHIVVLLLPSVCKVTSLLATFGHYVLMETWEGLDNKDRYFQRTQSWTLVLSLGVLCVKKVFCKCFPSKCMTETLLEGNGQGKGDNSDEEDSNADSGDFYDCLNETYY